MTATTTQSATVLHRARAAKVSFKEDGCSAPEGIASTVAASEWAAACSTASVPIDQADSASWQGNLCAELQQLRAKEFCPARLQSRPLQQSRPLPFKHLGTSSVVPCTFLGRRVNRPRCVAARKPSWPRWSRAVQRDPLLVRLLEVSSGRVALGLEALTDPSLLCYSPSRCRRRPTLGAEGDSPFAWASSSAVPCWIFRGVNTITIIYRTHRQINTARLLC